MAPEFNYTFLTWDSDFFGFNTAEASVSHSKTVSFNSVVEKALSDDVTLLTIKCPHGCNIDSNFPVYHVDTPVVYEIDYTKPHEWQTPSYAPVSTYDRHQQRPQIDQLAIMAGQHSRYYHDPLFPRRTADNLFKAWVSRALTETATQHIHVAKNNTNEIGGLLISRLLDLPGRRVGNPALLSVKPDWRGQNLTKAFCNASYQWFADNGVTQGYVVTQARNHIANKIYQSLNWILTSKTDIHHIWLKPPV